MRAGMSSGSGDPRPITGWGATRSGRDPAQRCGRGWWTGWRMGRTFPPVCRRSRHRSRIQRGSTPCRLRRHRGRAARATGRHQPTVVNVSCSSDTCVGGMLSSARRISIFQFAKARPAIGPGSPLRRAFEPHLEALLTQGSSAPSCRPPATFLNSPDADLVGWFSRRFSGSPSARLPCYCPRPRAGDYRYPTL
jgi:hypothetical protein